MQQGRDPAIDALRVVSLAAVVAGHWLVTGFVPDGDGLRVTSALAEHPQLRPATWVLQTLGPLFFAAGFAAGRRGPRPFDHRVWPAAALAALAWAGGGPLLRLALSPLWFAAVLLVLSRLRPVLDRSPGWVLLPAGAVAALDATGTDLPLLRVLLVWSVPYGLGLAHARGRLRGGAVPALAGTALVVALVGAGGFPATAVGIPGEPRSPLNPPNLVALGLALAQVGAFLLVRDRLRPVLTRHAGTLRAVNSRCLPVYLLHLPVACAWAAAGVRGPVALPVLAVTLHLLVQVLAGVVARLRAGVGSPTWRRSSSHG